MPGQNEGVQLDGAKLIADERRRQIDVEGWTTDHDAGHKADHLARAAACYATPSRFRTFLKAAQFGSSQLAVSSTPIGWPWAARYWKSTPNDRVRELVKAGALIAAEIDRLNSQTTEET